MERHIKKHRVFSWSHAYLDYSGLKEWLGKAYPFGEWYVIPSVVDDPLQHDVVVESAPHGHIPSPMDVARTPLGAEIVSPLSSSWVIGEAARRPLEIICYAATEDSTTQPPCTREPLWPSVAEVRYPQQVHTLAPVVTEEASAPQLHRICIPSRTIFARNPFEYSSVPDGNGSSDESRKREDEVPAPVMIFGCDSPLSHLNCMPLDPHVLAYIRNISAKNLQFTTMLEAECAKVEHFYLAQTRKWSKILIRVVDHVHVLLSEVALMSAAPAATGVAGAESAKMRQRRLIKQLEATEFTMQRIYFAYTLLARFLVQNTEAVHHLLRKVETRSQQHLDAHIETYEKKFSFLVRRVEKGHAVGVLLDWMEKEYIALIGGDKKSAARELHVAEDDEHTKDSLASAQIGSAMVVGLMMGLSIGCVVMALLGRQMVYDSTVPITTFSGISSTVSTGVMALMGLATFFTVLFSINVAVWDSFGVHYAFIFELDERHHWDGLRMLRYSMRYTMWWSIGLLAFVYAEGIQSTAGLAEYVPYVVLGVFGLMLGYDIWIFRSASSFFKAVPMIPQRVAREGRAIMKGANRIFCCSAVDTKSHFPSVSSPSDAEAILQRRRRKKRPKESHQRSTSWFRHTLWRIVTAPFYSVAFSDFYIADQLTSLTGFFGQIQVLLTTVIFGAPTKYPIFASLPHVWRLLQCLRRFRDQPSIAAPAPDAPPCFTVEWWHPNLTNALKYLCGLLQIIAAWRFDVAYQLQKDRVARTPGTSVDWSSLAGSLAMWIVAASAEYLFKAGWDLYMDAGLLRKGIDRTDRWTSFLRPKLLYPVYSYWMYITIDLTFRLATMVRIVLIAQEYNFSHVNPVFWWALEVIRRFVWNFFRVESEQINNMEKYRAVDVVPPVWAAAEQTVLGGGGIIAMDGASDLDEDDMAMFGALWGDTSKESELPSPSDLFRRLPQSNQQSALFGFFLQQRGSIADSNHLWTTDQEGLLNTFDALNTEHQTRIVFLAVGSTPFAQFMQTHKNRARGSSLFRRRPGIAEDASNDHHAAPIASGAISDDTHDERELVRAQPTSPNDVPISITLQKAA